MIHRRGTAPGLLAAAAVLLAAAAPVPGYEEILTAEAVVQRAAAALRGGGTAALAGALRAVAADPRRVFGWLAGGGGCSLGERAWRGGVLALPGSRTGERLAVFWAQHDVQSTSDHVHRLVPAGAGWEIGPELPETETFGYRLRDHSLEVSLDPPRQAARIVDEVRVEAGTAASGSVQLRLSAVFQVDAARVEGRPAPFAQVGGVVYVAVPPPIRASVGTGAAPRTLRLEYHGFVLPPEPHLGNSLGPDEVVLTSGWYPSIARLPAANRVRVTVPRGWTAVSQGDLERRSETAGGTTFEYRMPVPNCFFTLMAAPYTRYERRVHGRRYRVLLMQPETAVAEQQLSLLDGSFRFFERHWGPYPFRHFSIVDNRVLPFALESYTFTAMRAGVLPTPNPHEWAHTWWGGFVPNTYLQDLWSESFATYASSLYLRRGQPGRPPEAEQVYWRRSRPGLAEEVARGTLATAANAGLSGDVVVGYTKGALVLQNLEETLGFAALMRLFRRFRDEHPRGEAATWDSFERTAGRHVKEPLGWWFDQWIRRPGLPRLRWENVRAEPVPGGYEVRGEIVQSDPPYRLRVPVWLDEGARRLQSAVEVSRARTPVVLQCAGPPTRLRLDPEFRLPRAVAAEEMPWRPRGGPRLVIGAAAPPAGDRLRRGGPPRAPETVTERELRESELEITGGPASNPVWSRLAAVCPFQVEGDVVLFRGRRYPGGRAVAVTPNPLNPARSIRWSVGRPILFDAPEAPLLVFDAAARLVGGRAPVAGRGPTVFVFPGREEVAPLPKD